MKNTAAFEGSVLARILGTQEMGFAVSWRNLLLTTSPTYPTTASNCTLALSTSRRSVPPRAWLALKWIVITVHYRLQHPLLITLSPPKAVSEASSREESQKQGRAHEAGWLSAVCYECASVF